jgi:UDP-glucose 4-epimerase
LKAVVTGGAGFIGSNLVDTLCSADWEVVVVDDLSNGIASNVNSKASLVVASTTDADAVATACAGADVVFHLGALGSVKRSIDDPLTSDLANVHGTLTVLTAARAAKVRSVISASSSSVYGGALERPTPETAPTRPRSPYAVTKLAGEHYARVFAELHDMHVVALRFFNVFGPRQRPDSAYAAVIPRFISALRAGEPVEIHGDGTQTRDFTYVADVVQAMLCAAAADPVTTGGNVYNIAAGGEHSLLELLDELAAIMGVVPKQRFCPGREGDVAHSCADSSAAARDLQWQASISFRDGLQQTVAWQQEQ